MVCTLPDREELEDTPESSAQKEFLGFGTRIGRRSGCCLGGHLVSLQVSGLGVLVEFCLLRSGAVRCSWSGGCVVANLWTLTTSLPEDDSSRRTNALGSVEGHVSGYRGGFG